MTAVDRITYQQTFPTGPYANVKLGIEMSLVPGMDDVQEAFHLAKQIVNDAFKSMNPNIGEVHTYASYPPMEKIHPDPSIDEAINLQLEETKRRMNEAKNKQDAEAIMRISGFSSFNLELKQILNSKPE